MSKLYRSIERPRILDVVERLGHTVFETGDWNLNIIAERKIGPGQNAFNDYGHLCWKEGPHWMQWTAHITTDPGRWWVDNGTKDPASLCPGQYRGAWTIGKHKGQYEALTQRLPVRVWRDRDRNGQPDRDGPVDEGIFGINWHRANSSRESTVVDKWSAGCMVFANPIDFNEFMSYVRRSSKKYGRNFTGTLVETKAMI